MKLNVKSDNGKEIQFPASEKTELKIITNTTTKKLSKNMLDSPSRSSSIDSNLGLGVDEEKERAAEVELLKQSLMELAAKAVEGGGAVMVSAEEPVSSRIASEKKDVGAPLAAPPPAPIVGEEGGAAAGGGAPAKAAEAKARLEAAAAAGAAAGAADAGAAAEGGAPAGGGAAAPVPVVAEAAAAAAIAKAEADAKAAKAEAEEAARLAAQAKAEATERGGAAEAKAEIVDEGMALYNAVAVSNFGKLTSLLLQDSNYKVANKMINEADKKKEKKEAEAKARTEAAAKATERVTERGGAAAGTTVPAGASVPAPQLLGAATAIRPEPKISADLKRAKSLGDFGTAAIPSAGEVKAKADAKAKAEAEADRLKREAEETAAEALRLKEEANKLAVEEETKRAQTAATKAKERERIVKVNDESAKKEEGRATLAAAAIEEVEKKVEKDKATLEEKKIERGAAGAGAGAGPEGEDKLGSELGILKAELDLLKSEKELAEKKTNEEKLKAKAEIIDLKADLVLLKIEKDDDISDLNQATLQAKALADAEVAEEKARTAAAKAETARKAAELETAKQAEAAAIAAARQEVADAVALALAAEKLRSAAELAAEKLKTTTAEKEAADAKVATAQAVTDALAANKLATDALAAEKKRADDAVKLVKDAEAARKKAEDDLALEKKTAADALAAAGAGGGTPPVKTPASPPTPLQPKDWQKISEYNKQDHENFNSRLFYSNEGEIDKKISLNDIDKTTKFGESKGSNFYLRINKIIAKNGQEITFGDSNSSSMCSIDVVDTEAYLSDYSEKKSRTGSFTVKRKMHISEKSANDLKDYQELLYIKTQELLTSVLIKFSNDQETLKDQVELVCSAINSLSDIKQLKDALEANTAIDTAITELITGHTNPAPTATLLPGKRFMEPQEISDFSDLENQIPPYFAYDNTNDDHKKLMHDMAKGMADNIVQKRLLSDKFSVEKENSTTNNYDEHSFSAIKILRSEDVNHRNKITIDASGQFDKKSRCLNISFGDGKYYLQIILDRGENGETIINEREENFKIFEGGGGNFKHKLDGGKKKDALETLKKYKIDLITGLSDAKQNTRIKAKKNGIKLKSNDIFDNRTTHRLLPGDKVEIGKSNTWRNYFGLEGDLKDVTIKRCDNKKFFTQTPGNIFGESRKGVFKDNNFKSLLGANGAIVPAKLVSINPTLSSKLSNKLFKCFRSDELGEYSHINTRTSDGGNIAMTVTTRTKGDWKGWKGGSRNRDVTYNTPIPKMRGSSPSVVDGGGAGEVGTYAGQVVRSQHKGFYR